jgi:hypothetical protein
VVVVVWKVVVGHPGSENVGKGDVDGKQPPYVRPHGLILSTQMVGIRVLVGTAVVVGQPGSVKEG